jgi:excisionase family DNA binding protein
MTRLQIASAGVQVRLVAAALSALALASLCRAAEPAVQQEVLDVNQAAALLRVEPALVRTLAEQGRIPARAVGREWRFSRSALIEWLKGDEFAGLPRKPPVPAGNVQQAQTLSAESLPAVRARGVAAEAPTDGSQAAPPARPQPSSAPPPTVGQPPTQPTAEEIALRDQRILLRRGAATLDLGVSYSRSEQSLFPVVRVEQSTIGAGMALRYGLRDELQLTLRVPAASRRTSTFTDATISGTTSARTVREDFLGDAAVSLLGVALHEATGRPNIIWSIDGVVPSGPGDTGIGGGFVLSKSYDPAVIFAGFNYLYGISIDPSSSRRVLARHNFGLNLGYTYAVNDNLALNTSLVGVYRDTASPDGVAIPPPSERYALQFGMTWLLARGLFLEPGVALRLGGDAPDFTFLLNVPYSF